MWLDIFFFITFILGIFQLFILFNIGSYYKQLQVNLIRKITIPSQVHKIESEEVIQYFNLISHYFILLGFLTSFWYIYLGLIIIITISNYFSDKYKVTSDKSGEQITKSIKRSKIVTYSVVILKTIVLFGISLMYFHGYINILNIFS